MKLLPFTRMRTKLQFWIKAQEIEKWIGQTQFFFILAIGRSGTTFLADLLKKATGAAIFHEPVHEDYQAYLRAFHNPDDAKRYIDNFRKKEMYLRVRDKEFMIFGEVNSLLRRHVIPLKDAFPNATMIHLIRDGREVVRSMMSRNTMTVKDKHTFGIRPKEGDPWREKWDELDRFARICWYWQVENSYLRSVMPPAIKFEDIILDYDEFKEKVLNPCHIYITKNVWEEAVNHPVNRSKAYQMPRWAEWSRDQKKIFEDICSKEMIAGGYDI